MTQIALDTMIDAARALIGALDGPCPRAIERATTDYARAVDGVRGVRNWGDAPDIRARVEEARTLADTARARVNLMADTTRQRLGLLAKAAGRETGVGYGRNGRLR